MVRAAQEILVSMLPGSTSVYYELEGDTWRCRAQTGTLAPEVQALVDAGRPYGAVENIVTAWEDRRPLFVDGYDVTSDTHGHLLESVSGAAYLPLVLRGAPRGLLAVALWRTRRGWSRTERALVLALTHSLELALEGMDGTRELQERTRDLARSNAELERFAYVASHDLQEPLRTIASFTELLDRRYGGAFDERGRAYLRLVVQGAERMKTLVDDLLVYSRVGAEQLTLAPVSLDRVLAEALTNLSGVLDGSGARVTSDVLPVVLGSELQLVQVMQNLVGNALKFRREGVTPTVRVTSARDGDEVRVSVRDNGIGIEARYLERIFVMFQRLHRREDYPGTGLGLAICRRVVERHGGRMWVESTPGEGSTFHFTLRAADPA